MNGNKATILGVSLNGSEPVELLNTIVGLATRQGREIKPAVIFTPNPEFLVEAQKDGDFKALLNKADINLVDGFGLVLAGRILKQDVGTRVSGADVVERLLKEGNEKNWTIGIAGARGGIQSEAEELIKRLGEKYPNVTFINLDDEKLKITRLQKLSALAECGQENLKLKIALACHGMKKQENWIWVNKDKIRANVFMGVGGSLDFLAGYTKRAPLIMRRFGLEWLWRGLQRPKHFKRIWRATGVFGWMVFRNKIYKS